MKKLTVIAALIIACLFATRSDAQSRLSISFQNFYDDLSPDGQWVSYPDYGYVWIPDVPYGFKPYATNGHWVYTENGWTWLSDYHWGWATFHYGRWGYDNRLGWYWLPDYEWAPSWVVWGNSNDRYYWAPLGPRVSFGANFNWNPPANYWVSTPHKYINNGNFQNHVILNNVTMVRNINIIRVNNTTVINNRTRVNHMNYHPGPQAEEVQRYSGVAIKPARIVADDKPGREKVSNGTVTMFRPAVNRENANNAKPVNVQPHETFHSNHGQGNPGTTNGRTTPNPNNNRPVPASDPIDNRGGNPMKRFPSNETRHADPVRDHMDNPVKPVNPGNHPLERPSPVQGANPNPVNPGRRNEQKPHPVNDKVNPVQNQPIPHNTNMIKHRQIEQRPVQPVPHQVVPPVNHEQKPPPPPKRDGEKKRDG